MDLKCKEYSLTVSYPRINHGLRIMKNVYQHCYPGDYHGLRKMRSNNCNYQLSWKTPCKNRIATIKHSNLV